MPVVYNRSQTGKKDPDPKSAKASAAKAKPGAKGSAKGKSKADPKTEKIKLIVLSSITLFSLVFIGWYLFGQKSADSNTVTAEVPRSKPASTAGADNPQTHAIPNAAGQASAAAPRRGGMSLEDGSVNQSSRNSRPLPAENNGEGIH